MKRKVLISCVCVCACPTNVGDLSDASKGVAEVSLSLYSQRRLIPTSAFLPLPVEDVKSRCPDAASSIPRQRWSGCGSAAPGGEGERGKKHGKEM